MVTSPASLGLTVLRTATITTVRVCRRHLTSSSSSSSNDNVFRRLSKKHNELKHRIHNTRIPLSPPMRRLATTVYFSIPLVTGYVLFNYMVEPYRQNAVKDIDRDYDHQNVITENEWSQRISHMRTQALNNQGSLVDIPKMTTSDTEQPKQQQQQQDTRKPS